MRIKVWDLPTRLFHWILVLAVATALLTGLQGGNWMAWHERAGLLILGLLVFRLVWGVLGSTHARFAEFLPTPGRIIAYLRGRWQGEGHNPLGALSIFALLAVLLLQAGSGLVSNDDIAFDGPLYTLVSEAVSDRLTRLHRQGLWMIVGLVSLHILAALVYLVILRKNLIGPMITGWKRVVAADRTAPPAAPAQARPWALLLALGIAAAAVWAADGGLLPPPPPPPPPGSVPSW